MGRLPYLLPWLRVELLIRTILTTQWDAETWPTIRQELPRVLKIRSRVAKDGWWN